MAEDRTPSLDDVLSNPNPPGPDWHGYPSDVPSSPGGGEEAALGGAGERSEGDSCEAPAASGPSEEAGAVENRKRKISELTREDRERIKELLRSNLSIETVASQLNLPPWLVKKVGIHTLRLIRLKQRQMERMRTIYTRAVEGALLAMDQFEKILLSPQAEVKEKRAAADQLLSVFLKLNPDGVANPPSMAQIMPKVDTPMSPERMTEEERLVKIREQMKRENR